MDDVALPSLILFYFYFYFFFPFFRLPVYASLHCTLVNLAIAEDKLTTYDSRGFGSWEF
jgi:hypothetical protein